MKLKEFMRVGYYNARIDSPVKECERFYYFSDGAKAFKSTMRSSCRCSYKAFSLVTIEDYRKTEEKYEKDKNYQHFRRCREYLGLR